MAFEMIAFDADDTLWHSECYYHDTQAAWRDLLSAYGVAADPAMEILHRTEVRNLPAFGYGIKGFTLSMAEAAIEATGGQIRAADVQRVIDLGRAMVGHEVRLLDHAAETVARLAQTYPLMVITKGDLMDQERKMAASGLAQYFQHVEVVSEKTPPIYATLLRKHHLAAQRFLMVGNAIRSDILPVLELGGAAVYVPYALAWAHESAALPDAPPDRFAELAHLGLLPDWVAQWQ